MKTTYSTNFWNACNRWVRSRAVSRDFHADATGVENVCVGVGLSQAEFACLIDVQATTLQNREPGRRELTGPVKALVRVLRNVPESVMRALAR